MATVATALSMAKEVEVSGNAVRACSYKGSKENKCYSCGEFGYIARHCKNQEFVVQERRTKTIIIWTI